MPIGLLVPDMAGDVRLIEAIANGAPGAPLGRELELAQIMRFIKAAGIANTVWVTADVHYTAAHHYDRRAPRSRTSTRSGSSSPAPCTLAPSVRTRSTRHSAPRSAS